MDDWYKQEEGEEVKAKSGESEAGKGVGASEQKDMPSRGLGLSLDQSFSEGSSLVLAFSLPAENSRSYLILAQR